jgi:hypothetical protein
MPSRLVPQLAALNVRLSLETDPHERLVLRVELADVELRLAHALAHSANAEPLPKLLALLATAQITADTAGQAIARDPALAAQVAAVAMPDAQTGDVQIGQAAGGNILNVYIGEKVT